MELFRAFGRLALEGQKTVNRGLKRFEQAGARAAERMQRLGGTLQNFGGTLSRTVTPAILAATTALGALAVKTADYGKSVTRASRLANASTTEFQRWAAAAETVGVEQDQLQDILKDVNDRVGDFLTTGGGPMADFFEKIAPQVGLTADHFRELSGPQALQLYVRALEASGASQQEMTFFMEAMASEATALLPLLRNNGAEMQRLGDQAEAAGRVLDRDALEASKQFSAELKILQQTVQGLMLELGSAFLPILTELVVVFREQIVPVLRDGVQWLSGWLDAFAALSPETQKWIVLIGAAVAVLGPFLVILGAILGPLGNLIKLVTSVGRVFSVLRLAALAPMLPVIAAVAAAVALLWAAWEFGPEILAGLKIVFSGIVAAGQFVIDGLKAAWAAIPGLIAQVVGWFSGMFDSVVGFFKRLPGATIGFVKNMVQSVLDWVNRMVDGIIRRLNALYNAVVGNSIIPDLHVDVVREMAGMADESISEAERMGTGVEDAMPRDGLDGASVGASGAGAATTIDMRHSVIRDDRDMLNRMLLRGIDPTGVF